jgi:hypothetical protein
MTTTTTIGQLVATLFDEYENRYRDEKLAAVATQVVVDDLIRAHRGRPTRRRRSVRQRHTA